MLKSCFLLCLAAVLPAFSVLQGAEWPNWRGLNSDGVSGESALPGKWSAEGENLLWKAPYGSRSTPIVLDGRVCVIRLAEPHDTTLWQEQVVCLNADTGEQAWEYRFNIFQTDIPHHRIGWASLVGDPATGNVYAHGVEGMVIAFDPQGKVLWERATTQEIGRISGFGGRTVSGVLDGDLLIVSFLSAGWGSTFIPRHRFYALDKRTGETVWLATPGNAPYDTTYSAPVVREINAERLLIAGNGDGGVYALQAATGKNVWAFSLSKRGINASVVVDGNTVYASHSEENTDASTAMGRLVALDAATVSEGKPKQLWMLDGFTGGYASPAIHNGILYHVDNSANLVAFDAKSGEQLWLENLGIAQKASPAIGDGKLYVSDVDGKFHIFKLNGRSRPEKIDLDEFKNPDGSATQINGSPAIAGGRVYLATNNDLYCIGKKSGGEESARTILNAPSQAPAGAAAALVQVVPAEINLRPGGKAQFTARTFDAKGRFIGEAEARWSIEGDLEGGLSESGAFEAGSEFPQGGHVIAAVGDLEGIARVAVRPASGFTEDFSRYEPQSVPAGWSAARGRFQVVDKGGEKMLYKPSGNPRSWRTTVYVGDTRQKNYDVEAEVMSQEARRRMADVGVVSHRYTLALMGNAQTLMIRTWMSEMERFSKEIDFAWEPDIWYRIKLRVEPSDDGSTTVRGKIWEKGKTEPDAWTIEATDPLGHAHGSPGIYGYSSADIYYDNLKVTPFGG